MAFRITFFNQVQQTLLGGWGENFWQGGTDLAPAVLAAENLRPILDQVHGVEVVMTAIRISDATNFRDVTQLPGNGVSGEPSTATNETDYVTTSALLKLRSSDNYVTRQWIRGVRDSAIDKNGKWNPKGTYLTNWKTFLARLSDGTKAWQMRVLDRGRPRKDIKELTGAGVVTVTAHGFPDLSSVRISRVKGDTRANKVWKISVLGPDTFQLIGWVALATPIPYLGGGIVRPQTYVFKQIQLAEVVRATSHKTGRPFGLLGGRRRTRRT